MERDGVWVPIWWDIFVGIRATVEELGNEPDPGALIAINTMCEYNWPIRLRKLMSDNNMGHLLVDTQNKETLRASPYWGPCLKKDDEEDSGPEVPPSDHAKGATATKKSTKKRARKPKHANNAGSVEPVKQPPTSRGRSTMMAGSSSNNGADPASTDIRKPDIATATDGEVGKDCHESQISVKELIAASMKAKVAEREATKVAYETRHVKEWSMMHELEKLEEAKMREREKSEEAKLQAWYEEKKIKLRQKFDTRRAQMLDEHERMEENLLLSHVKDYPAMHPDLLSKRPTT